MAARALAMLQPFSGMIGSILLSSPLLPFAAGKLKPIQHL
jgi:hypothetical protein